MQKLAATALWLGAKLEEVPEVSKHPEQLLRKVLIVFDRICLRRDGQKVTLLDHNSKVGGVKAAYIAMPVLAFCLMRYLPIMGTYVYNCKK